MKKSMKWLLCAGLIAAMQLPAPTTAHAQITHASQGRLDENATAALAKAAKYLQSVKGTVTLTMLDGNKKQVARQTAKVSYMKGKYSLVADNMEIVCNGTTIWQWNKDAKEIVINNMPPETEVNLMDPGRLMTYYPKNFRAKYIRTDDDGTAVIDLTPLSSQSYHKLRLLINEETGQLKQLEVHKYDSSREIYDFSKLKRAALPSTFGFKPEEHPECEVIDMR